MRKITEFALLAVLAAGGVQAQAPEANLVHPSKMVFEPLDFDLPEPERHELPNGLVIYIMEDRELPLISISASIRTGAYLEPEGKEGLAELTGAVMRTGGTEALSGDEIDEKLEFVAASAETAIGISEGSASMSVLEKDFETGFTIFADVLRRPRFDPRQIELRRNQMLEAIKRRNDQPGDIVSREYRRITYKGHPYARISTATSVKSLTRDDMVKFHKDNFHPNNMVLAVSGDFDRKEMLARLEKGLGDWEKTATPNADPAEVPLTYDPTVYLIQKEIPQTNVRMGHLGVAKGHPDYFALQVLDNIMGSNGFISRLMREVRSNRGLAYSVGSSIQGGRVRGTVMAYTQTKVESTHETIRLMKEVMEGLEKNPPSEKELQVAKDSILNSFVFQFTSVEQVVSQKANLEFQHLPPDWLEKYRDGIAATKVEDVLRVAREHLHPEKMTVVVVGNPAKFDKELKELGLPVVERPLETFD